MKSVINSCDLIDAFLTVVETGDTSTIAQAISDSIDGSQGFQLAFVDGLGNFNQSRCLGLDPDLEARLAREFSTPATNPVVAQMDRVPYGRFTDIHDFVDMRLLEESEFYQEMLAPRRPGRVAMMSLHGAAGVMSLGLEQDKDASLNQAQIARGYCEQVHRALSLWFASQSPSQSAFALEASGVPLGSASQYVEQASLGVFSSAGSGRPVRTNDKTLQPEFDRLLFDALAGRSVEMVAQGIGGLCRVRLTGNSSFGNVDFVWVEVTSLHAPVWNTLSLGSAYTLTPREASVVLELLSGAGTAMIAEKLNLSLRSVRTYLSAIYAKTETTNQAQLVSKLLGG